MNIKKGQSVLEYVIVLTVIVAAVLAGALLFAKKDEAGGSGVSKIMKKSGGTIEKAADNITAQLKVK